MVSKDKSSKIRTRSFGTTMGITSIIAILVILVLVVFSTLSLITAKADQNLSQKTSDNITAYYEADGKGEDIICTLSDIINSDEDIKSYAQKNQYQYKNTGEGELITFTVPIDSSRNLNAEVLFDGRGKVKEKKLWQVVPANEWKEDNQIELYDPGKNQ